MAYYWDEHKRWKIHKSYIRMKAVCLAIIALLLVACAAEAQFKETEKTKEPSHGAPPAITIPENLRMRVAVTSSFNFGVGIDIVRRRSSRRRRGKRG